jgi:hypothetical protein
MTDATLRSDGATEVRRKANLENFRIPLGRFVSLGKHATPGPVRDSSKPSFLRLGLRRAVHSQPGLTCLVVVRLQTAVGISQHKSSMTNRVVRTGNQFSLRGKLEYQAPERLQR